MTNTIKITSLLAMLGSILAAAPGQAQTLVTLDTSGLSGQGTFYFDFQLLDGNGTGDGNSNVTISGLTLTGGTVGVTGPVAGTVSGDPAAAGLTLTDSDPGGIADYQRAFTVTSASSLLTFQVGLFPTAPLDAPIPDTFNFLILESDGVTPLPTLGPTAVEIVSSNFTSLTPSLISYSTDPTSPVTLAAPTFGGNTPPPPPPSAVPESGIGILMGMGLPGLVLLARRRSHHT